MRKNFGANAVCYPMPVFIIGTYNADGTPNAMNAAWGGHQRGNGDHDLCGFFPQDCGKSDQAKGFHCIYGNGEVYGSLRLSWHCFR